MRSPRSSANPAGGILVGPHVLACRALIYAKQPTGPSDVTGRPLSLIDGTFTDDASQRYARTYTLRVTDKLVDIAPGEWVKVLAGAAPQQPDLYTLPSLMVTTVTDAGSGTIITAEDIGVAMDEVVFESDTNLTGTLRTLATSLTQLVPMITRPVNTTLVPAVTIPKNTVAEFGHGRWDVLTTVADQVGVDLFWTDAGDLQGIVRTAAAPTTSARLDDYLVDPGQVERNRMVTRAVVQVARDKGLTELVGVATVAGVGQTISDRMDGDATTTQAQANALASGLLARRRAQRNTREIATAPAPWLEAGTDTVTLSSRLWWVRSIELNLPTLETKLTLRDAS